MSAATASAAAIPTAPEPPGSGRNANSIAPALWLSLRVCRVIDTDREFGRAAFRRYALVAGRWWFSSVTPCVPAGTLIGAMNSIRMIPDPVRSSAGSGNCDATTFSSTCTSFKPTTKSRFSSPT